jgi:predicted GH43/DUF377 family glycosyl hydrolase
MIELLEPQLEPDASRVVIRPFHIAPEPRDLHPVQISRAKRIFEAVVSLDYASCVRELASINADFEGRHWETKALFLERNLLICAAIGSDCSLLSVVHKELIGAYFCLEYAYCTAAVTNPSIVAHPDQTGLRDGDLRFILSLRNMGEGHISSISFREGILTRENHLHIWPNSGPTFAAGATGPDASGCVNIVRPPTVPISAAVLFPVTASQRHGLEDLRMVAFVDEDATTTYHGTYTAYSGNDVRSELFTTTDFTNFMLRPMTGTGVASKGMALFPRKINGSYAMLGRHDGESQFFLQSDNLLDWDVGEKFAIPMYLWDLVQTGNCGSPIELDEGFLVVTHGVGAMRKYAIGAMLLDKNDPRKVLGRSAEPILTPTDAGRNGYVPNVVYSCGALRNKNKILLPYGVSDTSVAFALLDIPQLLDRLV